MKTKHYYKIIIVILLSGLLFGIIYFNLQGNDFEKYKAAREEIANMINNGELAVNDNGLVSLPEEQNHLSDSGEVCVVKFYDSIAVYFFDYRGMLGDSKGYLYVISSYDTGNLSDKCSERFNFVNVVNLSDNWYSCSTSDY